MHCVNGQGTESLSGLGLVYRLCAEVDLRVVEDPHKIFNLILEHLELKLVKGK